MNNSLSYEEQQARLIAKIIKFTLLAIVLLVLFFSTVVVMGTGKVGVVTRFGKVTGRELNEGLNAKLPWPIEKVHTFNIQVQKEEAEASAATSDLQDVKAKLAVNYHLERGQVGEIYQTIGKDYKNRIIEPAIQEVFKATTAQFNAGELLTKRPEVKEMARQALQERLQPRGIILDDVSIVNFSFGEEFNRAIEEAQVAKQQVVKAQQELERAKVDAETRIKQAQAEAEAQRLKRETLTPDLVQLKWIEKWNGVMPTVVGQDSSIIQLPVKQ